MIKKTAKKIYYSYKYIFNSLKFNYIRPKASRKILKKACFGLSISVRKTSELIVKSPCFTNEKDCSINIRENASLKIGGGTFFNANCIIVARESIEIGENCLFGPNVYICDHDHEFDDKSISKVNYTTRPIKIGHNCWIGAGTIILKGSKIGNNAIVGAGSVITGEVPDGTIVIQKRKNTFIER